MYLENLTQYISRIKIYLFVPQPVKWPVFRNWLWSIKASLHDFSDLTNKNIHKLCKINCLYLKEKIMKSWDKPITLYEKKCKRPVICPLMVYLVINRKMLNKKFLQKMMQLLIFLKGNKIHYTFAYFQCCTVLRNIQF